MNNELRVSVGWTTRVNDCSTGCSCLFSLRATKLTDFFLFLCGLVGRRVTGAEVALADTSSHIIHSRMDKVKGRMDSKVPPVDTVVVVVTAIQDNMMVRVMWRRIRQVVKMMNKGKEKMCCI